MENKVYLVGGWIVESSGINLFTGFFNAKRESSDDFAISGKLNDTWGESRINGHLGLNKLEFEKVYLGQAPNIINYRFSKNNDGIFTGKYSFERSDLSGESVCEVFPLSFYVPENLATQFRSVDSMIEGMIEDRLIMFNQE